MTNVFRLSAYFGLALLCGFAFHQNAGAAQAPLTWPEGRVVSEEADAGGGMNWQANLIVDDGRVVANIHLMKMDMDENVQKDIEQSYAAMQEVAVQTARAGHQTMTCARGVKKEIGSLPAVQGTRGLSGDEGEQKLIMTLRLAKGTSSP